MGGLFERARECTLLGTTGVATASGYTDGSTCLASASPTASSTFASAAEYTGSTAVGLGTTPGLPGTAGFDNLLDL